ncbi:MAG: hypothetical protein AAGI38_22730 [Bacteroidota bacterium]
MNEEQHTILFWILAIGCLLLILLLNVPLRNYVPVIWGLLGVGFHSLLFMKTWMGLSRQLIEGYKGNLKELNIRYQDDQFRKTVDMFALFQEKQTLEKLSRDIGVQLSFFRTYFQLTLIAFSINIVLGILTVLLT